MSDTGNATKAPWWTDEIRINVLAGIAEVLFYRLDGDGYQIGESMASITLGGITMTAKDDDGKDLVIVTNSDGDILTWDAEAGKITATDTEDNAVEVDEEGHRVSPDEGDPEPTE